MIDKDIELGKGFIKSYQNQDPVRKILVKPTVDDQVEYMKKILKEIGKGDIKITRDGIGW